MSRSARHGAVFALGPLSAHNAGNSASGSHVARPWSGPPGRAVDVGMMAWMDSSLGPAQASRWATDEVSFQDTPPMRLTDHIGTVTVTQRPRAREMFRYWGGKAGQRSPRRRRCAQPRRNAIDARRVRGLNCRLPTRLRYSSPRFDAWRMRFDDGLRKPSDNGSLTSSGQVRALVTGNGHGVRATLEYRLVERAVLPCFGHR